MATWGYSTKTAVDSLGQIGAQVVGHPIPKPPFCTVWAVALACSEDWALTWSFGWVFWDSMAGLQWDH